MVTTGPLHKLLLEGLLTPCAHYALASGQEDIYGFRLPDGAWNAKSTGIHTTVTAIFTLLAFRHSFN
jgi:hypothetical protein